MVRKALRGLNLPEVLMALSVVTISILSVLGTQAYFSRHSAKQEYRQEAVLIASGLLDSIEITAQDDVSADFSSGRAPVPPEFQATQKRFEYEVLEAYIGDPANELKQIEIVVYWEDGTGFQNTRLITRVTRS